MELSPPLYETDAYAKQVRTKVLDVSSGESWVTLADTVLYPEGGGQPSDHGDIEGVTVVELTRTAEGIRHTLAGPSPFRPGDEVEVTLDWSRRFDHMQQHTAQHLLTALAHRETGRRTTSFHLGATVSDIELEGAPVTADELERLEALANAAARAAHPVRTHRISKEEYESRNDIRTRGLPAHHSGDVRLVEIEALDLTACGGTHVASTAELGGIKVLGAEGMRGGTRVHWVAGNRLLSRLADHEDRAEALRGILRVGTEELGDAVAQRMEQLKTSQKEMRALEEDLADALVTGYSTGDANAVVRHFEGRSGAFIRTLAGRFAQSAPHRVAFFTAEEGDTVPFVIVAGATSGLAASDLGTRVASALGAKGGGREPFFQGKAPGPIDLDSTARAFREAVGEGAG